MSVRAEGLARRDRIAAAVLAGGQSGRYGGLHKGMLQSTDGVTFIARAIREVAEAGIGEVAVFGTHGQASAAAGQEAVGDRRPGHGPLSGIETALMHYSSSHDAVLFLPCDMPGITACEIHALVTAFVNERAPVVVAETRDSLWHPLCAVAHVGTLGAVQRAIDEGRRSVRQLWAALGARPVLFEDHAAFVNINTPEDMKRWQATMQRKG